MESIFVEIIFLMKDPHRRNRLKTEFILRLLKSGQKLRLKSQSINQHKIDEMQLYLQDIYLLCLVSDNIQSLATNRFLGKNISPDQTRAVNEVARSIMSAILISGITD